MRVSQSSASPHSDFASGTPCHAAQLLRLPTSPVTLLALQAHKQCRAERPALNPQNLGFTHTCSCLYLKAMS